MKSNPVNPANSGRSLLLRLLAAALSLLLLLSVTACGSQKDEPSDGASASADSAGSELGGDFTLLVSSAEGKPGETVTLKLSLANNPGISGFSFCIGYDSVKFSAAEGSITLDVDAFSFVSDRNNKTGLNYEWAKTSVLDLFDKDGEIGQVKLTIAEDTKPGDYTVRVVFRNIYDSFYKVVKDADPMEQDIPVTAVNGTVTVLG